MGFSFAQIDVQKEKCKIKSLNGEERDNKKDEKGAGEREEGDQRPTSEDYKAARRGSWPTGRVQHCAETVSPMRQMVDSNFGNA